MVWVGSFTWEIWGLRCLKHAQVLTCLVCPCHKSLLPSTVHNTLAWVNITYIHISGCTLSISAKPESAAQFPTSTTSVGLQCLSVGEHVHLVWFVATSRHVWPPPRANDSPRIHKYNLCMFGYLSFLQNSILRHRRHRLKNFDCLKLQISNNKLNSDI